MGRATTGKVVFSGGGIETETVTWTIPADSTISEFTFTLTTLDGTDSNDPGETDPALYYNFSSNGLPTGLFVNVTNNGISNNETSHIHLVAGNPVTTDIFLGDDDQYVKIERNGGDVVIGTDANTKHWRFGDSGDLTLPQGGTITESVGTAGFVGGLTLTVADVSNFAVPGNPAATVDAQAGSFTNVSWQYIQFGDWDVTAIQALVTDAGGSDSAVLPITWGAGSTALTGFVLVQITGATTFQMCPVVDAGAGSNTPVSGTWFFDANIGGTTVVGADTIEVTVDTNTWTFGGDGRTKIPHTSSGPSTARGEVGDKAGMILVSGAYLFYCYADYTDGTVPIWQKTAMDNTDWD